MTTAVAVPRNTTSTILAHFFSSGVVDDTYVVEGFKARAHGDFPLRKDWRRTLNR